MAARPDTSTYFPPMDATTQPNHGHHHHEDHCDLDRDHDQQTLSNTLANSHLHNTDTTVDSNNNNNIDSNNPYYSNSLQPDAEGYLGSPLRQPKFTEEWDASVRGSSVLNHPVMQRSSSVASHRSHRSTTDAGSFPDGNAASSLSRGNTLKKKNSLRKGGGSLRRSGSRRSMKAGSVRSLALQSDNDPEEANNVFHCPVPTTGNPTETLATRFQSEYHPCPHEIQRLAHSSCRIS